MKSIHTESSTHNETAMSASYEVYFAHWMLTFQKQHLAEHGHNCQVEKSTPLYKTLRLIALLEFAHGLPEFVRGFDAEK